MSLTFSINLNTITETTRQDSIYTVLDNLPNNTAKLISPRDVRDAFLTSFSNSIFKITTPNAYSSYPYIGIDTNNPINKDYKKKILLGKRSLGSLDIMTPSLLNSDTDIFFFNTKSDSDDQSSTKLSFLAGTNSSYYSSAPYIESYYTGSEIDFNITNPYGPVNIVSTDNRVSINNVLFPTESENSSDIADGKVLRYIGTYPTGSLRWVYPSVTSITIGSTSSVTNIYGSPVLFNGYPLEFVEDTLVPVTIGGVEQGMSFSSGSFNGQDWPVTEVIRKLLYPYVEPELSISVSPKYAEVGVTTSVYIEYSITRFSNDIAGFKIEDIPFTSTIVSGSYSGLPGTGISTNTSVSSVRTSVGDIDFKLSVSDSTPSAFSYSQTDTIKFVDPIYYGFTSSIINGSNFIDFINNNASKLIDEYKVGEYYEADYDGIGYLHLAYPVNFSDFLNEVKDPNGFIIHDEESIEYSSLTYSDANRSTSYPYSLNYRIYRTKEYTSWNGPSTFKFKF